MSALANARHELFAQALAKGKCQSEAYAAAGYTPSEPNASRLIRNDKVSARVTELLQRASVSVGFTLADAARQLDEDRKLAHDLGQPGAAVSASLGKAKLFGLVIERAEVKNDVNLTSESAALSALAELVAGASAEGEGRPRKNPLPN